MAKRNWNVSVAAFVVSVFVVLYRNYEVNVVNRDHKSVSELNSYSDREGGNFDVGFVDRGLRLLRPFRASVREQTNISLRRWEN